MRENSSSENKIVDIRRQLQKLIPSYYNPYVFIGTTDLLAHFGYGF